MRILFQPVLVKSNVVRCEAKAYHSGMFSGLESIVERAWYVR